MEPSEPGVGMVDQGRFILEEDPIARRDAVVGDSLTEMVIRRDLAPDFLIVGAPRAATTWLSATLGRHPEAFVAPCKELKFFSSMCLRLDPDWYLDQFEPGRSLVKGEATPSYASLPLSRIRLIARMNPAIKIVYLVREPGERLISSYQHAFPDPEKRQASEIVAYAFSDGPVVASDYEFNLRRWLSVFPRDQVYIAFYDDLLDDAVSFAEGVASFLGLPPRGSDWIVSQRLNASARDVQASDVIARLYPALFAPRLARFRRALERLYPNLRLPSWLAPDYLAGRERFVKAEALQDGSTLFFVDGHFVCGPEESVAACRSLEELRVAAEGYAGIGIGGFRSEAIMKSLLALRLDQNILLSLAHNDNDRQDLFLVRADQLGWNIVYFRSEFYCARVSAGHMDFRLMSPEEWRRRYENGDIRKFPSLQAACDFTALLSPLNQRQQSAVQPQSWSLETVLKT